MFSGGVSKAMGKGEVEFARPGREPDPGKVFCRSALMRISDLQSNLSPAAASAGFPGGSVQRTGRPGNGVVNEGIRPVKRDYETD